jgi:stearoyl-CoA desaturase (delta-9 desaturase)
LFGAATFQNSVLVWAADHREHHRHVDREGDPYNIGKGFFWAHIGWMFYSPLTKDDFSSVKDLLKDKMVVLQHRYYLLISPLMGFGFPLVIGALYGRPMAGLLWGGLARVVFGHHTTFLINSAAHMFGSRPYSKETSARDFWLLAFFTYGEGFHNFHHAFASDYRNGVRWFQWDPSKWTIWVLSKVGLTSRLQRVPRHLYIRPRAHLRDAS